MTFLENKKICMYVCVYIYIYIHIIYIHIIIYIYIYVYIMYIYIMICIYNVYVYIYIYIYICIYIMICIYNVYVYVCVYIYIYIYICLQTKWLWVRVPLQSFTENCLLQINSSKKFSTLYLCSTYITNKQYTTQSHNQPLDLKKTCFETSELFKNLQVLKESFINRGFNEKF